MLTNLVPVIIALAAGFVLDSIVREEGTIEGLIKLIKNEK